MKSLRRAAARYPRVTASGPAETPPILRRRLKWVDSGAGYWQHHKMHMSVRHEGRSGGLGLSAKVLPLARVFLFASLTAGLAIAQTPAAGRTVWDGAYTEAQATRGTMAFGQSCAGCHTLGAEGRGPLTGEKFSKSFTQRTVGDLLQYVSTNMPNGQPGSLSTSTYSDIVAVILKSNGFPAGMTELERGNGSDVKIVPRNGSAELSADTMVRVVGCLAKSGSDWIVTSGTVPERAERAGPGPDDATKPLGKRTMTLKFVLTRLDSMIDSRVSVSGLLIGADGVDGINVTAVSKVAPKCP